jgi:seryl-tRNA synthetase
MLDIKFIRENAELIQEGAKKKHINFDVQKLISIDDERKVLSQQLEEKRAYQNKVSESVVKADPAEKSRLCLGVMERSIPRKSSIAPRRMIRACRSAISSRC